MDVNSKLDRLLLNESDYQSSAVESVIEGSKNELKMDMINDLITSNQDDLILDDQIPNLMNKDIGLKHEPMSLPNPLI
jgi:hypothetical protein